MAGEALLGAAFGVLLDRLASKEFTNFFRSRKHDERLLDKLKLKLIVLNKVLNDAEEKQFTDRTVKAWLDELKDAVYHAEDLVDEIATEALRCKVEADYPRDTQQRVRDSLTSTFAWFSGPGGINSKLENVIDMLNRFVESKDIIGLKEDARWNSSQTRRPTSSLVDESCVIGREKDKTEIMELLLSGGESSNKFDVIPIVGMGGLGKTTLAQLLYNDSSVVAHFDQKAWVCVSDVFDVSIITRKIVEAFTGQASVTNDLDPLQVKLKESMSGKRFLIVLDDVWNENYEDWDKLITPFTFGARGSKILVTTRSKDVANIMQTIPTNHCLQELSEEDSWMLFSKHAFEKANCSAHPDLEQIGKKIVEKCKGLPLAVKTLGGLLRSERDLEYWNKILKSATWELPKEKSNILPALRLSYHYLPSKLKRCFAYCSIFVKDYEFNMQKLVSIWMAEGLLEEHKNNNTIEEEGCECFCELLSRSFFQRSKAHDSLYVMHDLIHDLAQYVMGDFCYSIDDGNPPHDIAEKVRHISFNRRINHGFGQLKEITKAKYLRTFLMITAISWPTTKVMDEILLRSTRLRVLSLSRYAIGALPSSIGDLMHLRFLDLSRTGIRELPDSVCKLYNLETLLLERCFFLTTLSADLPKLISLRLLNVSGTSLKEMPMHISRLKDLQQLTAFVVGKCTGAGIKELGEFSCLRGTISISGLQNVENGNNALEAKMSAKKHLEEIELKWDSTTEDSQIRRDVLEKLEPHKNLKRLRIFNYGGTSFPTWLGDQSFCNMVSLQLAKCDNCFSLPPLGQMPSLKELTFKSMSGITSLGSEFYGESSSLSRPFQSLETLSFRDMAEWVHWSILDAVEFPRLQELIVFNCPKLIGDFPNKLPSLVKLWIHECPRLTASIPRTTSIRQLLLRECQGVQLEWHGVSSIEELFISGNSSLKEFPSEMVTLTNLKDLSVTRCPSLYVPPYEGMSHRNMFLQTLTLNTCESLESFPLGLFPNLRRLSIWSCANFETLLIPERAELQNPLLLQALSISQCNNMLSFPMGGLPAPNLAELSVWDCKKLKALPEQMHTLLPSLRFLWVRNCPEIESFPGGGLPSKLDHLFISSCEKLVGGRRDWGLQTLPSLTKFTLGEHEDVGESFPEEGLLGSTLKFLEIDGMPNLKSLNGRGLQHLGILTIVRCHQLQSFPEERLPTSLYELRIYDCPLLKPRCRREEGEDWHKIAHIPYIEIDYEVISE